MNPPRLPRVGSGSVEAKTDGDAPTSASPRKRAGPPLPRREVESGPADPAAFPFLDDEIHTPTPPPPARLPGDHAAEQEAIEQLRRLASSLRR